MSYQAVAEFNGNSGIVGPSAWGAAVTPLAAPEIGGALVPLSDAAYYFGTIRTVAGYQLGGVAGLIGDTYNVNVWALYETEGAQGLQALANALKAEASAAGASSIEITGTAIRNTGFAKLSPATLLRFFGFSATQVNPTTIVLRGPL